jgi:hypothetical protein
MEQMQTRGSVGVSLLTVVMQSVITASIVNSNAVGNLADWLLLN